MRFHVRLHTATRAYSHTHNKLDGTLIQGLAEPMYPSCLGFRGPASGGKLRHIRVPLRALSIWTH